MKGYGRLIASAREQAGLGPDELAERLGKGRTIVYRLETEQQEPTADQINVLTALFPVSAEQVLIKLGVPIATRGHHSRRSRPSGRRSNSGGWG